MYIALNIDDNSHKKTYIARLILVRFIVTDILHVLIPIQIKNTHILIYT